MVNEDRDEGIFLLHSKLMDQVMALHRRFDELVSLKGDLSALKSDIGRVALDFDRSDNRYGKLFELLDARLKMLEQKEPLNDAMRNLANKVIWLLITAVVGAVLAVVFWPHR